MSRYNGGQVLLGKMTECSHSRVDIIRGLRVFIGGVVLVLMARVDGEVFEGGMVVRKERSQLREIDRLFGFDLLCARYV